MLADLAIESEAATVTALRLARAFDTVAQGPSAEGYDHERLLQRLATPVVKYWVCKRAPVHAAEALECLGGNGFVEESGLPRLFRQSPLNGIWEGSGNVICLDVLRAMVRRPEAVEASSAEVGLGAGADSRLDEAVRRLAQGAGRPRRHRGAGPGGWSRPGPGAPGLAAGAARADPAVADAFCAHPPRRRLAAAPSAPFRPASTSIGSSPATPSASEPGPAAFPLAPSTRYRHPPVTVRRWRDRGSTPRSG